MIIESDEFYSFLRETKGLDKTKYLEFAKNLMISGQPLSLADTELDEYRTFLRVGEVSKESFRIVEKNEEIERVALKGCVEFISHYFLEKDSTPDKSLNCKDFVKKQKGILMINRAIGLKEEAVIVSKLFDWEIPVRVEHQTYKLVIDNVGF